MEFNELIDQLKACCSASARALLKIDSLLSKQAVERKNAIQSGDTAKWSQPIMPLHLANLLGITKDAVIKEIRSKSTAKQRPFDLDDIRKYDVDVARHLDPADSFSFSVEEVADRKKRAK